MKRFQYKVLQNPVESTLNRYGEQGWELVSITRDAITRIHYFYMKREIIN